MTHDDIHDLLDDIATDATETTPKVRRAKKSSDTTENTLQDCETPNTPKKRARTPPKDSSKTLTAKEAVLEFVQRDDGVLILREVGNDTALVSIEFADQIKEMIGHENIQAIGQHMIHAAIANFMHRQMSQWHAHVYDEPPKHFS